MTDKRPRCPTCGHLTSNAYPPSNSEPHHNHRAERLLGKHNMNKKTILLTDEQIDLILSFLLPSDTADERELARSICEQCQTN
jgi:hypothetical protein